MGLKVTYKGGGSMVNLPPKFSSNAETLFVAWKNSIIGYNTKTGKTVCELKDASSRIVGFDLYSQESCEYIIACTDDGEIIQWKCDSLIKIRSKKIKKSNIKTFHMVPAVSDNKVTSIISYETNNCIKFILFSIYDETLQKFKLTVEKGKFIIDVAKDFFCVATRNYIYFIKLEEPNQRPVRHKMKQEQFTCVACHPELESVIAGDSLGRTTLWTSVFAANPVRTVYHWHTLPARCVAFSKSGTYFYSGGEECVLVQWQLDQNETKKFLPRLPSTVLHVVVKVCRSNGYIAIATADNGVSIVDLMFNPVSLIQHLVFSSGIKSGMIYDTRSKALVTNGTIGQVQFYDPRTTSLLYKMDINNQNKFTNERNCVIENFQVTKIALNQSGLWMATVEERKDEIYTEDRRLKFWKFHSDIQNFELNTFINAPHEDIINNVMFQPNRSDEDVLCATVASDRTFKIWQIVDIESIYKKGKVWYCMGTGSYKKFSCQGLSFSVDGSLIAVGFGSSITLWTPTFKLKQSLNSLIIKKPIEHIQFGAHNACDLVVATTEDNLSVWNVRSLHMVWTVNLNCSLLVNDYFSGIMAAITTDNRVYVFSPSSEKLIYSSENLLRDHNRVLCAAFVPSKNSADATLEWYERTPLYFLDSDMELFCIGCDEEYVNNFKEVKEENTLFNIIMSNNVSRSTKNADNSIVHRYEKDSKGITFKEFLEYPILNAPVRFQYRSILKSMILQKEDIFKNV